MIEKLPFGPITVNEFDEKSTREFRAAILDRELEGDEPIIVHIDSYGGDASAVLNMIDAIESSKNTVITVASGKAYSCGAILLMSGDIRFVTPKTRILVHAMQVGLYPQDIKEVTDNFNSITELNNTVMAYMSKRMKMKESLLRKMLANKRDLVYTAEEAVAAGIADHVGEPIVTPVVTWNIGVKGRKKGF